MGFLDEFKDKWNSWGKGKKIGSSCCIGLVVIFIVFIGISVLTYEPTPETVTYSNGTYVVGVNMTEGAYIYHTSVTPRVSTDKSFSMCVYVDGEPLVINDGDTIRLQNGSTVEIPPVMELTTYT